MVGIHRNKAIEVRYQALSQPAPSWCWDAAHAISLREFRWHEEASLEIRSHPELSESQQKIIARHYGMLGGHSKIKVRKARLDYALHRPGLVTNSSARYPQNRQITLLYKAGILQ